YQADSITTRTNIYRNWISEVTVEKDGKLIFNKIINDDFLLDEIKNTEGQLAKTITTGTLYNQEYNPDNNSISLYTVLVYPGTESRLCYMIRIDKSGKYIIEKMPT